MQREQLLLPKPFRFGLIASGAVGLGLVYLFQRCNYAGVTYYLTGIEAFKSENFIFIVNRTARLILNDGLCMLLMLGLFQNTTYLRLGWFLFLFELIVLLPGYLYLKLTLEGTSEISSPLLSQIHRMIVNPLLMIVLIGALFYQRYTARLQ